MVELPVVKKCCLCIPLRYGLFTWGYVKLITSLKLLVILILCVIKLYDDFYEDVPRITIFSLLAVVLLIEIGVHIMFIIGVHKKNVKLLKLYYYYAMLMWVATLIMAITGAVFFVLYLKDPDSTRVLWTVFYSFVSMCFVISIVAQTFLIQALRSEIIKLRSNCPYRFVKDDNEPEGAISSVKYEEDIMSMENGKVPIL